MPYNSRGHGGSVRSERVLNRRKTARRRRSPRRFRLRLPPDRGAATRRSSPSSPGASSKRSGPSACSRPCAGTTRSRSSSSRRSSASCRRSTRPTTSGSTSGFDPKAKLGEFEDIARDIDRELGERRRHRADHDDDGARVSRRRAHARRARHAELLRVVAQALRLAEGQVPRRALDGARPRAAALRDPDERRRVVVPDALGVARVRAHHRRRRRPRGSSANAWPAYFDETMVRVEVGRRDPRRRLGRAATT